MIYINDIHFGLINPIQNWKHRSENKLKDTYLHEVGVSS